MRNPPTVNVEQTMGGESSNQSGNEGSGGASAGEENLRLGLGEAASFGGPLEGLSITLEEAFRMPGDEFSDLSPGEFFIVFRFEIQNDSPESLYIYGGGLDFVVYNQDSYELEYGLPEAYIDGTERGYGEFSGTDVRTGGNVSGTVTYVAQDGDSVLVEYSPDEFSSAAASWDIGSVDDLPGGTLGGAGAAAGQYE